MFGVEIHSSYVFDTQADANSFLSDLRELQDTYGITPTAPGCNAQ